MTRRLRRTAWFLRCDLGERVALGAPQVFWPPPEPPPGDQPRIALSLMFDVRADDDSGCVEIAGTAEDWDRLLSILRDGVETGKFLVRVGPGKDGAA